MNQHSSLGRSGSLLERASEVYDFGAFLSAPPAPTVEKAVPPKPETAPVAAATPEPVAKAPAPVADAPAPIAAPRPAKAAGKAVIDRAALAARGMISPDAPTGGLAEEFRIVKRQLLRNRAALAEGRRHSVLVASAHPGEGKTFCAINLALSLAGEEDVEVLLVDGDFSKPEILDTLGLEGGPGFLDAIADPLADPEAFVIRTDIPGLSVLPAGRSVANATELLASGRTADLLDRLGRHRPDRIVLFDSPPALMASQAAVIAGHVGQTLMIVRADQTIEADLREALGLLSACPHVSLLLNAAAMGSGRRFGSYYGKAA
ncbi:hypothetical protein [Allosphingosinicella indica]|uniref:Exopolysaccharide/PEP-CTERM locus tyrosine autokinase n=1 Tax=Allosphingosinicella indica TaxID=941907 RepID=A0A1X7GW53_9SPHN|nr:hypothetical protein [Allosphingosinicella indica]SMF75394.1 exopolysaccharide/PEP-CTERM locus tyrosine autokinase [Allosphingosinicella indica]